MRHHLTATERVAEFNIRLAQRNPDRDPVELAMIGNALIVKARYLQTWALHKVVSPRQHALLKKDYAWMDKIGFELGISILGNTKPGVLVVIFMATEHCEPVRIEVPLK